MFFFFNKSEFLRIANIEIDLFIFDDWKNVDGISDRVSGIMKCIDISQNYNKENMITFSNHDIEWCFQDFKIMCGISAHVSRCMVVHQIVENLNKFNLYLQSFPGGEIFPHLWKMRFPVIVL